LAINDSRIVISFKSVMNQNKQKTSLKLINLGCSKNQVDSENILSEFHNEGYTIAQENENADIIILNTCGFIESAKQESINEILNVTRNKIKNQKIVVAGCLSERYQSELKKRNSRSGSLLWNL